MRAAPAACLIPLLLCGCRNAAGPSTGGYHLWAAFETQPTAVPAGVPITAVRIRLCGGYFACNEADGPVTLAITRGTGTAGAVLRGTTTRQAMNGVVVFTDLVINKGGAGYTLTASPGGATSEPFNITGPAATVRVAPVDPTMGLGTALRLTPEARDSAGTATGGLEFAWASSDPSVVQVSAIAMTDSTAPAALITARAYGSATISATTGAATGSVRVTVAPLSFVSVSAGYDHTCGVTTTGAAFCWGGNSQGQLGVGTADWRFHSSPEGVAGGLTAAGVSASSGSERSCLVTTSGAVYCWGGYAEELANGVLVPAPCMRPTVEPCSTMPARVAGALTLSGVSLGGEHGCGVTAGGAAYCWGDNENGQLGDSSATYRATYVPVAGALTFSSVSAGGDHTCGVTAGGAAYCWGSGLGGRLGTTVLGQCAGLFTILIPCNTAPVPVAGNLSFASVSAGGGRTCGVTTAGAAYCWGGAGLGNGSDSSSAIPVATAGALTFASVSAGSGYSCGVTTGGAAYCWGGGALGNGSLSYSSTPAAVAGGLTFTSVSAGSTHACGVTTDGVAYCWGSNGNGQLGDGTTVDRLTPVHVLGSAAAPAPGHAAAHLTPP